MARIAARSLRGLVALALVAGSIKMLPNFTMFGGPLQESVRSTRTSLNGVPVRVPLPPMNPLHLSGSEALQRAKALDKKATVDSIVQHIVQADMGLHGINEPSKQQLFEYDRTLSAEIEMLEEQIEAVQADIARDSMAVETNAQVDWLQVLLQTVGEMKKELTRIRHAQASVHSRIAREPRNFLEQMVQAAACGFGGHKVVSDSDYPASGVSSFTGEPAIML